MPEGSPNVEAHHVHPEEAGQEKEMHGKTWNTQWQFMWTVKIISRKIK